MKKITSIFLTAIILFTSVFSLTAFATESPKTDALLDKLETEDELCISFTSGQSTIFSFLGKNPANKIALKDNEISYEIDNGFVTHGKEFFLCFKIVFHCYMVIQMVLSKICKHCHFEVKVINTALV